MFVGIIRFPGSNCDFDTLNYFEEFGHKAEFIWYKKDKTKNYDLLVLPGGFAFGDRVYEKATGKYSIDPGEMALKSPVMKIIYEYAEKNKPILGICNGFQILTKAGLLPGKLMQNKSKKFYCDYLTCKIEGNSFMNDKALINKVYEIPVAHGYGNYAISKNEYKKLMQNNQVFLRYKSVNPNGSMHDIAGVSNANGNIFGMMPHPERSKYKNIFMKAIENYVKNA